LQQAELRKTRRIQIVDDAPVNANVDPKFLTQQPQALLAKRDAKQLQKGITNRTS
jgi:hypothetical protein